MIFESFQITRNQGRGPKKNGSQNKNSGSFLARTMLFSGPSFLDLEKVAYRSGNYLFGSPGIMQDPKDGRVEYDFTAAGTY